MNQFDDRQRELNDRIERIRQRVKAAAQSDPKLRSVLLAVLDLLGDEL